MTEFQVRVRVDQTGQENDATDVLNDRIRVRATHVWKRPDPDDAPADERNARVREDLTGHGRDPRGAQQRDSLFGHQTHSTRRADAYDTYSLNSSASSFDTVR